MVSFSDREIKELVESVLDRFYGQDKTLNKETSIEASHNPSPDNYKIITEHNSKTKQKIIAIGADHGGYELKESIKKYLSEKGYIIADCGTHSKESVDYPDFAHAVALLVSENKSWRGIVIDGAGIGSCMTANKVPGVRAAMCYDHATAINSREHNDANVLTLGAGLIGDNLAKQIVSTWLDTMFGGGRHAFRVEKIQAIEKLYLKE